jgi:hypothetical protein
MRPDPGLEAQMTRPPTEAASKVVANVASPMEFLVRDVSLRDGRLGTPDGAGVCRHVAG